MKKYLRTSNILILSIVLVTTVFWVEQGTVLAAGDGCESEMKPVMLGEQIIFCVHDKVGDIEDRAKIIENRLKKYVDDLSYIPESIRFKTVDDLKKLIIINKFSSEEEIISLNFSDTNHKKQILKTLADNQREELEKKSEIESIIYVQKNLEKNLETTILQ